MFKEIKGNQYMERPHSWVRGLNVIKIPIFSKLIYRFKRSLGKFQLPLLQSEHTDSTSHIEMQGPWMAKQPLIRKTKLR